MANISDWKQVHSQLRGNPIILLSDVTVSGRIDPPTSLHNLQQLSTQPVTRPKEKQSILCEIIRELIRESNDWQAFVAQLGPACNSGSAETIGCDSLNHWWLMIAEIEMINGHTSSLCWSGVTLHRFCTAGNQHFILHWFFVFRVFVSVRLCEAKITQKVWITGDISHFAALLLWFSKKMPQKYPLGYNYMLDTAQWSDLFNAHPAYKISFCDLWDVFPADKTQ